jgi:GNAT superfamily N-acetyltransferase
MSIGEEVAVALTAEEITHDLASPLAFVRVVLDAVARGEELSDEDRDIAREEVDRLARLLASLRGAARRWPDGEVWSLQEFVNDARRSAGATLDVRIDPGHRGKGHRALAADLVSRALRWATSRGDGPVIVSSSVEGAELRLELQVPEELGAGVTRTRVWMADSQELELLLLRRTARALGGGAQLLPGSNGGSLLRIGLVHAL